MQLYKIASIAGFPSASQAATLSPNNKGETVAYQGCYQDNSTDPSVRIFPLKVQPSSGTITPTSCTRACSHYVAFDNSGAPINYAYAGLQYGAGMCHLHSHQKGLMAYLNRMLVFEFTTTVREGLTTSGLCGHGLRRRLTIVVRRR